MEEAPALNIAGILRSYFAAKPEVIMAFLFGSVVTGNRTSESDIDIAVYLLPAQKGFEVEGISQYECEEEIWGEVEKIIHENVDLVVLNRAPASVAAAVFYNGIPILVKDKNLYWQFFLTVTNSAEDFMSFVDDFLEIKQRSKSLSKLDRSRLIRIADFLEAELADINLFRELNMEIYLANASIRRNVERWTENIVNASIDIAKIILASQKLPVPQTYRETVENLSAVKGFSKINMSEMSSFTGLRNILARDYLDIRFSRIRSFVDRVEDLYGRLLSSVKVWLSNQPT